MQNETEKIIKNIVKQNDNGEDKGDNSGGNVQLVVFELDKEEYAVEITDLQEIKEVPEVTPIPNSPDFISGIFNLRGKIIIVVDLEKRFNLTRDNQENVSSNIIIAEVNQNNFGIIVDQVKEIINIPKSYIQATPSLVSTKIHISYLKGVIVLSDDNEIRNNKNKVKDSDTESRLIILLDLPKMLQEKELLSFSGAVNEVAKAK